MHLATRYSIIHNAGGVGRTFHKVDPASMLPCEPKKPREATAVRMGSLGDGVRALAVQ